MNMNSPFTDSDLSFAPPSPFDFVDSATQWDYLNADSSVMHGTEQMFWTDACLTAEQVACSPQGGHSFGGGPPTFSQAYASNIKTNIRAAEPLRIVSMEGLNESLLSTTGPTAFDSTLASNQWNYNTEMENINEGTSNSVDTCARHKSDAGSNPDNPILDPVYSDVPSDRLPFRCEIGTCTEMITPSRGGISQHLRKTHNMRRPTRCPWPGCYQRNMDPISVQRHVVHIHGHQFVWKCPWCGQAYKKGTRKDHARRRNKNCPLRPAIMLLAQEVDVGRGAYHQLQVTEPQAYCPQSLESYGSLPWQDGLMRHAPLTDFNGLPVAATSPSLTTEWLPTQSNIVDQAFVGNENVPIPAINNEGNLTQVNGDSHQQDESLYAMLFADDCLDVVGPPASPSAPQVPQDFASPRGDTGIMTNPEDPVNLDFLEFCEKNPALVASMLNESLDLSGLSDLQYQYPSCLSAGSLSSSTYSCLPSYVPVIESV